MIVVGLLVSFATCLSTYFQARLFLPVYSLFQMGMLLAVSLAANVLLERLEGLKNPRSIDCMRSEDTVTSPDLNRYR